MAIHTGLTSAPTSFSAFVVKSIMMNNVAIHKAEDIAEITGIDR